MLLQITEKKFPFSLLEERWNTRALTTATCKSCERRYISKLNDAIHRYL